MIILQLYSTFETTAYLEIMLSIIEQKGISKEKIFAVPLDNRSEDRQLFDNLHHSDGTSLIDIGMALSTAFSVVGASIGFKLAWGPIYWGLISACAGFVLGFAIRLVIELVIKKRKSSLKGKHGEVIVIIECEERQTEWIEKILWDHFAIGVAKVT